MTATKKSETLLNLSKEKDLRIMKTNFKHPKRRLRTLKSPIKKQKSKQKQKKRLISSLLNPTLKKVKNSPTCRNGVRLKPCLSKMKKYAQKFKTKPNLDISALKIPEITERFSIKLPNFFKSRLEEIDEQTPTTPESVDHRCKCVSRAVNEIQEEFLP